MLEMYITKQVADKGKMVNHLERIAVELLAHPEHCRVHAKVNNGSQLARRRALQPQPPGHELRALRVLAHDVVELVEVVNEQPRLDR